MLRGSIWIVVSILCLIAATIFLLRENYDAAFVLAALGALAWFLNLRSKLRATIVEATETTSDARDASEDDDDE